MTQCANALCQRRCYVPHKCECHEGGKTARFLHRSCSEPDLADTVGNKGAKRVKQFNYYVPYSVYLIVTAGQPFAQPPPPPPPPPSTPSTPSPPPTFTKPPVGTRDERRVCLRHTYHHTHSVSCLVSWMCASIL